MSFGDRLKHAWNAFSNVESKADPFQAQSHGSSYSVRQDRTRIKPGNTKSIIPSIYNRLAIDIAAVPMRHVILDQNGRFTDELNSGLNNCLTLSANLDQAARAFMQDIAMSLFEHGEIAIVPIETDIDPWYSNAYDVRTLRVGRVVAWHPQHVTVNVYDERTGKRADLKMPKSLVAIVENPLYTVMNEPNSNLQRLTRKIGLLDSIDEQAGSGKLDLIIQLPYVIKTEAKRQQAEIRRGDIEDQLRSSKYGIAYTDGTEKITQLNRSVENNMLKTVEYLTGLLYGQLGLTEDVFNGTASEETMLNYYNRTIEPILAAIAQAMKRTFLSKTARTRGQSIEFYRDPFKMVTITTVADLGDKLIRNKIMTSNEFRSVLALKPSKDEGADSLQNPNMPASADPAQPSGVAATPPSDDSASIMQSSFDTVDKTIDDLISSLEADVNG